MLCAAMVVVALRLSPATLAAQTLSIVGDRFAIDGTPQFLTFISYFGAMGAPAVARDLASIRAWGFDGIRIWPNLDTGPQLMNADGSLRPEGLARLRSILDDARANRLVVDVTFTYEHVRGMNAAAAERGIAAAAGTLRPYRHVIFDIQNERNVRDRRFLAEAAVARILRAIREVDPARIVTADNSMADSPAYAASFTSRLGLDVAAYHEARDANWYTLDAHTRLVDTLKSSGRPVYLQEPNRTRDPRYEANDRAEYFQLARAHAKRAGAAAWCFHTMVAVDFREGPRTIEERLRAFSEPEWTFVQSLKR